MAKEWGVGKDRDGYVNCYEIECGDLRILDLNAQDFINGTISYRQLNNAMHLGKLGQQFVLKSRKAFEEIKFIGSEIAESREWYAKKMLRDTTARHDYFSVERNRRRRGDLYITQIMDEEMTSDDPRLR